MPTGDFSYKEGTIETGYVIIDNSEDQTRRGNEFVWVPVDKNQKITLDVDSKEDIKSVVLYNPIGEKIVEEANKGKEYTTEIATLGNANCINGEYKAEVETASGKTSKTLTVRSLYTIDAFNDYYKTDEFINVMITRMSVQDKQALYASLSDYTHKSIANEDEFGAVYANMMVSAFKDETEEKNNATYTLYSNSVNENGGFYIARYEAGAPTKIRTAGNKDTSADDIVTENGLPVSKASIDPYNNITRKQALDLAKKVYTGKSDLLTGAAWDRTMDWIINKNDKNLTIKDVVVDSKSWGNYQDSTFTATGTGSLAKTGAFGNNTKVNNIFDLAGNVFEWSSESNAANSSFPCVFRGGGCYSTGASFPASLRNDSTQDYYNDSDRIPFCTLFVALSPA